MFQNAGNLLGGRIYDDIHDTLNDYIDYRNGIIIDNTVACITNSMFSSGNGTEIMFADGFKGTTVSDFFANSLVKIVKNLSFNFTGLPASSFCRYSARTHLTFAKDFIIRFALCRQSLYNGYGGKHNAIPPNLDLESVKDYLEHLYNWNTDEENAEAPETDDSNAGGAEAEDCRCNCRWRCR